MKVIRFASNQNNLFSAWMETSARTWSKVKRINVCLVNWGHLALSDYVSAALTYTRTVGNYIAEFIRTFNIPPKDVSIAGHSLGAQIAGFCGMTFDGRLGAIYGKMNYVKSSLFSFLCLLKRS